LVDKPRRRKKTGPDWRKIAAVVVVGLIVAGGGYYYYVNYIVQPPPVYAKISVGFANGTSLGTIVIQLYPTCAPRTVANFVSLANSGFYDNVTWHRIVKGFVIQTGDPNSRYTTFSAWNASRSTPWGTGGSNKTVPLEQCGWLHNYEGYVAMARQGNATYGLNTATSQFYINLSNSSASTLDSIHYTVFAKVISGMQVVDAVASVKTYTSVYVNQPVEPVLITKVSISASP
jgi:peptidyl-prolyl cis-trans isomerase B (cyclophilin B)